ncbi:MAG: ATP-binding protein [Oscillospiraceae bacterium]|nr:ATP-binding protein [Oscillospiraceae bacterium]
MAEKNVKTVTELVGDFYEGHANGDKQKMTSTLERLDSLLMTGEDAHLEFIEYFNELFSGRTAYNTLLGVKEYPVESVVRELLQNAFDCDYNEDDIKIAVNFKDNHTISISYNEVGFILEQFMFYLSFGRNTKNVANSEGRFGVGAKSVFMNVEWLSMRSNNFSFCITNNGGNLKITDINLRRPIFKGTEMVIKVDAEQHRRIKENFMSITSRKGDYINLVELCFAFNRKKALNTRVSEAVSEKRTFNIAVMTNGKLIEFYKLYNHLNKAVDVSVIRFTQGGKSVVDFICHENDGFVYLVPFAVAVNKRTDLVGLLTDKYNYFSTYELTGLLQNEDSVFANEKLSAFFISVPNRHITSFRTGIRPDRESEVISHVDASLKNIISEYKRFFVLELHRNPDDSGLYHLRPESYALEFIKNFILTCNLASGLKKDFLYAVSMRYSKDTQPLNYTDLQKKAFFSIVSDVSKESHLNGTAYDEFILAKLEKMNEHLSDIGERILYVGYEWTGELEGEGGKVYAYEFHKDGNVMAVSSEDNPAGTDYGLYDGFMSLTARLVEKALGGDKIKTEEHFKSLLKVFNNVYGAEYRMVLKGSNIHVMVEGEEGVADASALKIGNIAGLMPILQRHKQLFLTFQDYNETVKFVLNKFAEGKEHARFLLDIKEQGGEVLLRQDLDNKYCFMVYETEFPIKPDMANADLLAITGDIKLLIKSGVLNGKPFGFKYAGSRYSFEEKKISGILSSKELPAEKAAELFKSIYVCDLKSNKIALLDEKDNIIEITDSKGKLDAEKRKKVKKYIVMREDNSKEEFADLIEFIVTGENNGIIRKRYMGAPGAKIVMPDQLPFRMKLLPTLNKEEFKYLRSVAAGITEDDEVRKNHYAKDLNFKLFGYGGNCSFCGFETDSINGFTVRDFEVELMRGEQEASFNFSLYLCANDAIVYDSWVIDDLSIGGMSPFMWLEEVTQTDSISPEFLFCSVTYREQITHDMFKTDNDWNTVMSAPKKNTDVILSPLMAANWVEKNIDLLKK